MQFHAELEAFCGLTIFAHPHVAGGHAFDRTVIGIKHFGRGKAWKYFNAQGLGLLRQPAGHVTQADDVVAVVLKAFGQQPIGRADAGGFSEKHEGVIGHRLVQGRAHGLPVREQFGDGARVHDGARQNVRAWLGAFFQHHHRHLMAFFLRQLLQADGGGQARWAGAHHDHVVFHGFTGSVLGNDFGCGHRVLKWL